MEESDGLVHEELLCHAADLPAGICVQRIVVTPPDASYFLLPQFPVTFTLQLVSTRSQRELAQVWVVVQLCKDGTSQQDVPLRERRQDGECLRLRGTILPPTPGVYRYRIVLHTAMAQWCVAQGELSIAEPRANESWTQGPMITEIDDGLFLGNAAAAANPLVPGTGGKGILEVHGVHAVLNATADRDPSPALLGTGIDYVQVPFQDFSHHPLDEAQLGTAVHWIRERLENGKRVFVHCHAGIGRSGSLVVAYLLLFRYPDHTYDDVVAMVNDQLRSKRHGIYPHLGLPEAVNRLRAAWAATGKATRAYRPDPAGDVVSLAFESLLLDVGGAQRRTSIRVGDKVEIHLGSQVQVQVTVAYTGGPPRGVYLYTNLNHDGPAFERVLMRPVPGTVGLYEAELIAERAGDDFWLTAFAKPRRYDHDLKTTWLGGDVQVRVTAPTLRVARAE
jgi:hypothetical protein